VTSWPGHELSGHQRLLAKHLPNWSRQEILADESNRELWLKPKARDRFQKNSIPGPMQKWRVDAENLREPLEGALKLIVK
jgi:hypothetical protein